ncbi:hypothetical protein FAI40_06800 [Acetobacteraceae bacterium]|nr:hypothetical protein FAI40_06800 [Acetobacteraceae bacterium]
MLFEKIFPLKLYKSSLIVTAFVSFCFFLWVWYPGVIHNDATAQYLQALDQASVSDWHPPIMVRAWQVEMAIFRTPDLFFILPILAFTVGLVLLLWDISALFSLVLFLFLFFSPFYFLSLPELLKDNILIGFIFLFSGVFVHFSSEELYSSRYWFLFIFELILLFLMTALRFNAVFFTAPLLFLLLGKWRFSIQVLLSLLGIVLAAVLLTPVLNHKLLKASSDNPVMSLEIFDIAGSNHFKKDALDSKIVLKNWERYEIPDQLAACYLRHSWDSLGNWTTPELHKPIEVMGENHAWVNLSDPKNKFHPRKHCSDLGERLRLSPEETSPLWRETLKQYPLAYLAHRIAFFTNGTLGIGTFGEGEPWHLEFHPEIAGYHYFDGHTEKLRSSWIINSYFFLEKILRWMPWWNGYFWFLLCPFLFVWTRQSKDAQKKELLFANCFLFAAFCYLAGYFFIGVGADFRYIVPTGALTICALIFLYRFYFVRFVERAIPLSVSGEP